MHRISLPGKLGGFGVSRIGAFYPRGLFIRVPGPTEPFPIDDPIQGGIFLFLQYYHIQKSTAYYPFCVCMDSITIRSLTLEVALLRAQ